MHRALLVFDILLYIFTHVDRIPPIAVNNSSSPSRKSLASLAATCKAFYEPAMDLLWADVFGLERPLGCVTRLHPLVYRASRDWDPLGHSRRCMRLPNAAVVVSSQLQIFGAIPASHPAQLFFIF
ncbi:hypothetical protein BDR03DRAFT_50317 [Suillus americanus]|nr:hypothetical protein BDR03DRAFT_50317 [Suillus americanus]